MVLQRAPRQASDYPYSMLLRVDILATFSLSAATFPRAKAIVWGFTAPGAKVTTTMSMSGMKEQSFVAVTGKDGTWRQQLPAVVGSKVPWNFTFR